MLGRLTVIEGGLPPHPPAQPLMLRAWESPEGNQAPMLGGKTTEAAAPPGAEPWASSAARALPLRVLGEAHARGCPLQLGWVIFSWPWGARSGPISGFRVLVFC